MNKSRYTYNQIYRKIKGIHTIDNDLLGEVVSEALSKVPREVVDQALRRCQFIMTTDIDGMRIPRKMNLGRDLIVLSEGILQKSEKNIDRIILHEVAHCYLKHKSPRLDNLSQDQASRQEDEADQLARQWLRQ